MLGAIMPCINYIWLFTANQKMIKNAQKTNESRGSGSGAYSPRKYVVVCYLV